MSNLSTNWVISAYCLSLHKARAVLVSPTTLYTVQLLAFERDFLREFPLDGVLKQPLPGLSRLDGERLLLAEYAQFQLWDIKLNKKILEGMSTWTICWRLG